MRSPGSPSASACAALSSAEATIAPAHDGVGVRRGCRRRVVVHHPREQRLVETAPVDADAHRFPVRDRDLDQGRELGVALAAFADVARIDPVLRERGRAAGVLRQQLVPVEMEVADQRDAAADVIEPPADLGHRRGGLRRIDRHADELRPGPGERGDLGHRRLDVRCIRVGHRLHDDRGAAADYDAADIDAARGAALDLPALDRAHSGAHSSAHLSAHLSETRATLPRV